VNAVEEMTKCASRVPARKYLKALAVVEAAETSEYRGGFCPECRAAKGNGHYPDCCVGSALAAWKAAK
jgi:hypothetical protein